MDIEIILLRHAETNHNINAHIICGKSSHISINSNGILQCQKLKNWIQDNNMKFDVVYCSQAVRAKETLELLSLQNNQIIYSKALEELSKGEWEGNSKDLIYTFEQQQVIEKDVYNFKAPAGESQKEVEDRMYQFIKTEILEKETNGKFLIVSHALAINCLLRQVLDFSPNFTDKILLDNTGLTKIIYKNNKWFLAYINRLPHLNTR